VATCGRGASQRDATVANDGRDRPPDGHAWREGEPNQSYTLTRAEPTP
jgi:hypothetical protein